MNDTFQFTSKAKRFTIVLMIIGILGLAFGFATGNSAHAWANILLGSYFTFGIAIAGAFFVAANTIGYGGWYIVLKRVFEGMGQYIWVGGVLLMGIVVLGFAGVHHVYQWADKDLMKTDELIKHKEPFFKASLIISTVLIGGLILFRSQMRKLSLMEDTNPSPGLYQKAKPWAALYLVFFAVGSSVLSWHFNMSVDVKWFSTLFGWYNFASYFVASFAVVILLVIYLKEQGYLGYVTDEHLHDLGKYMFAFSIFWGYLWMSQYLLIWYAHIPEETVYFKTRLDQYPVAFFANVGINFFFPFLLLMARNSKRRTRYLGFVASVVLLGHFLDFHLMMIPGGTQGEGSFGLTDVLAPCFFAGLFLFVFFNALTKASLNAVNHPFWKESLQHHT